VIAEGERVTYDLKPRRDDPSAVGTAEYADAIIERLTPENPGHGERRRKERRER
jgi:isocitrate dehydrogenase (NAD+)